MRRAPLRAAHRWAGWVLGALFAFQGLTGSAIVFRTEIDRMLHPTQFGPLSPGATLPPARLLAAARAAFAGRGEVTGLDLPARAGEPATVDVTFGPERHAAAAIDPVTGHVFAPRVYEGSLLGTIYDLHNMYVLRDFGYRGVGVAGLVLLASILMGATLAWPRRGGWRRALASPPVGADALRRLRDQHARLGLLAAPLLLVAVATGVWMSLGDWARPPLARMGVVAPEPAALRSAAGASAIPIDLALDVGRRARAGWWLVGLRVPTPDSATYVVRLAPAGASPARTPDEVRVAAADGRIVSDMRLDSLPLLDRLWRRWLYPLHNGQALGLPHRLLVLALGVAPATLFGLAMTTTLMRRRRRANVNAIPSLASSTSLQGAEP